MRRFLCVAVLALALTPIATLAAAPSDDPSPAFNTDPQLANGFHHLYTQDFTEARHVFTDWENAHPDQPFGQVAIAASYLFEELYRQNVLSSDFFLDQKRFLNGIDGKPNAERMNHFRGAIEHARSLSKARLKKNPRDPEGLFGL
ncbi:MAG TPA: hypothetical protein VMP12_07440, partial [Candidatus Sulfotelmatobacter sp.]|nr:hypothetical protein [Candidatus Sulfotelmatobacter sp.]